MFPVPLSDVGDATLVELPCQWAMAVPPNLSLNPDASPAALTRRPLGAG
jgi:hypothetical protein